jgi:hypothetical protein
MPYFSKKNRLSMDFITPDWMPAARQTMCPPGKALIIEVGTESDRAGND